MEKNNASLRREGELDDEPTVEITSSEENYSEEEVSAVLSTSEPVSQPESEGELAEQPVASVSMEDLLEEQGLELDFPKQGEIRTGIIASIGESEILVSVGTKSEGVISGRELELIPEEEKGEFAVGREIPVYVVTPEDSNGNVVLSYSRAREQRDWDEVGRMHENEEVFESKIIGFNKGGLIVPIGGLRGFVPASQVSLLRRMNSVGDTPEERWGNMIDEAIEVRIIEVDRERRRLILSERQALQETRETLKDRLLIDINEGDIRQGRVTSLADFGAFVNIEGADGLVHLSEISWDRIRHPNEVLEIGQEVQVKVISVDRDRKRIGLSIRQLQEDPWLQKVDHLKEGMLVEGTITHLTKFGAFARLDENIEGLVHVSELSEQRIEHPKEVVHEGMNLTLRVIKIDPERHRIGLSLKKVDSPAYADLDWKMALSQEVGKTKDAESDEGVRSIVIEAEDESEEEAEQVKSEQPEQEAEEIIEPVQPELEAEEIIETVESEQEAEEIIELVEPELEAEEIIETVESEQEAEEIIEPVEPELEAEEIIEPVEPELEAEEIIEPVQSELETEDDIEQDDTTGANDVEAQAEVASEPVSNGESES